MLIFPVLGFGSDLGSALALGLFPDLTAARLVIWRAGYDVTTLFLFAKRHFAGVFYFRPGFTHSLTEPPTPSPNPCSPTADCQGHSSFPATPPETWAGGQLVQSHTWLNPTSDYHATPTTCSNPPLDSSLLAMPSPILSLSQIPYPAHYALLGLLSSTIPIRPIIPLPRLFYPPVGPVGGCPLLSRPVCLFSPRLDRCGLCTKQILGKMPFLRPSRCRQEQNIQAIGQFVSSAVNSVPCDV